MIYSAADDVAELLIPFVPERDGIADANEISHNYTLASLGGIGTDTFWRNVGISPELESDYLANHRLTDGLVDFLCQLPSSVSSVWCQSNDVSRWSYAVRQTFGLDQFFAGFVISGDVRSRKPSAEIYTALLDLTGQTGEGTRICG